CNINYVLNYPNINWKSIRINSSTQSYILKVLLFCTSIQKLIKFYFSNFTSSEIIKVRTLEGTAIRTRTIIQSEPVNFVAIMIKWQGSSLS
ncbi:unnamed protein product, partial [Rotaria sordida]